MAGRVGGGGGGGLIIGEKRPLSGVVDGKLSTSNDVQSSKAANMLCQQILLCMPMFLTL